MRILGIDLGTTSIKAVELDSAFGRFEILDYYDHKIEHGEMPGLAITRLMQALQKRPDRIAIAMPTRHVTFRTLRLPTRDRKAIQSSVGFELEDEIPFPIENCTFDYSTLSQNKAGSEIHVAATLNRHLSDTLNTFTAAGVDPEIITSESWAYRNYLNRVVSTEEQKEPILLVDIGSSRTTLYLHWQGAPVLVRELPWGGRDLTHAIASKYGIPIEQAEAAKLDHGFVVRISQEAEVTAEQREFSAVLHEPLLELLSELKQVKFSCKSLTHHNLSCVYISGGTVLLPGLAGLLEEQLIVPMRQLKALSTITTSGVTYSEASDAAYLLAVSIALTQVGADRSALINFRKGEFSKSSQNRQINLTSLRKPLLAGGAIAISLFLSMMIESRIYKSRIQEVDAQLERGMKTFFGSVSGSAIRTYLSNTPTLKNNINKELSRQRDLAKLVTPNPHSPLEYLKGVSSAVGKDVVVDLMQFQVGAAAITGFSEKADQTVSVTFLVANAQVADQLATLLGRSIQGLQKGRSEEVTTPEGKRWKVTFTGKPQEEMYAK